MIYNLTDNLKTRDKNLFERWKMPHLKYNEIEKALESGYTFNILFSTKRHSKKTRYVIYRSEISQIEYWVSCFNGEKEATYQEILCYDDFGFVVSHFPYNPEINHENLIDSRTSRGFPFVQSSDLRGHSEYVDESFFTEEDLNKEVSKEYFAYKKKKCNPAKDLRKLLHYSKRWLVKNHATVEAQYLIQTLNVPDSKKKTYLKNIKSLNKGNSLVKSSNHIYAEFYKKNFVKVKL
jgi:hypothetical protein